MVETRAAEEADRFAADEIALHARDVRFDLSRSPLHWIPGDPYASHFATAINLFVPEGERWFCKVFTEALGHIRDEGLREDVLGFIGQEAMHAKCHEDAVPDFLERHGIDPSPAIEQADWLFGRLWGLVENAGPLSRRKMVVFEAVLIGAIEHFTAVLGHWLLNNTWDERAADPAASDLYRWHGAEEVEHRHVAHNVARYFGASYPVRLLLGFLASAVFLSLHLRGIKYLVRQDPELPNLGHVRLIWKLHRAGRRGTVPRTGSLLAAVARLFNPRYSPEAEGNTAQAVAYLATSPAVRALHR